MNLDRALSPHFTLLEMVLSETAERIPALRVQQRNPPDGVVENLQGLVDRCLEPLRTDLGFPLHVNSGYRCPDLNRKIGGAKKSQHLLGQAADLVPVVPDEIKAEFRQRVTDAVFAASGLALRANLQEIGLLFAWVVLHLDRYDVDQLIHEYGQGPGRPAWVHASSRPGGDGRRQILRYSFAKDGTVQVADLTVNAALRLCC